MRIERMTNPRVSCVLAGTKKRPPLLAEAIYLDTETSNNYDPETGEGHTWIYQWAFRWCRQYDWGRTPEQLLDALQRIDDANGLTAYGMKCLIFIHNASYDLSYLMPYFRNKYGGIGKVLATAPHKMITFEAGPWEVHCTYRLSNRSLYKWGKDLGIRHGKKKGLIDYGKRRYQDSPLYKDDWVYQLYDVLALEECVLSEMVAEQDTLRSLPLTSTGYIRRHGRKLAKAAHDWADFQKTRMSVDVYKSGRFAFSGGLTHGNRFLCGDIVDLNGEGRERDFRSDYPSQARCHDLPVGPWTLFYEYEPGLTISWERIREWESEYCMFITVLIGPAMLHKGETLPYLQISKCLLGAEADFKVTIEDNGRAIQTEGFAILTFTEIDWEILREQYTFEYFRVLRVEASRKGPLPDWLKELIDFYYIGKTKFKNEKKRLKESGAGAEAIRDADISLTKSKDRLNGIYGLCATDMVRQDFEVDAESWEWTHPMLTEELIEEKLAKFYRSRSSYMRYAFGIYITAYARKDLMDMYRLIGPENFLYCDTDSIYYRSTPENEARLDAANEAKRKHAMEIGAYVEVDGKAITYDAFDPETGKDGKPLRIQRFIFLHAKAYAYETDDGELHCTVAGVAARDGKGYTREQELGSLENFKAGFTFTRCGSTAAVYLVEEPQIVTVEGHRISTAGGCVLIPSVKTLHDEYDRDSDFTYAEEMSKREALYG